MLIREDSDLWYTTKVLTITVVCFYWDPSVEIPIIKDNLQPIIIYIGTSYIRHHTFRFNILLIFQDKVAILTFNPYSGAIFWLIFIKFRSYIESSTQKFTDSNISDTELN